MIRLKYAIQVVVIYGFISWARYVWKRYSRRRNDINSTDQEDDEVRYLDDEEISSVVPSTTCCFGIITNLHNGYGLIDKEIFFDLSSLISLQKPKEGFMVRANVTRSADGRKLVAERVEIVNECWENDGPEPTFIQNLIDPEDKATVGKVTEVTNNICWVNNVFCIDLQKTEMDSFYPAVNDWVTVLRFEESDERADSKFEYKINPLRSKEIVGRIINVDDKLAIMDDNIYILLHDCDVGYVPCVGDEVKVSAIESSYENFEWRGIRITVMKKAADDAYQRHRTERVQMIGRLMLDKEGISITSPIDFGDVYIGKNYVLQACISNGGSKVFPIPKIYFKENCQGQLTCGIASNTSGRNKRVINPGEQAVVKISNSPGLLGTFKHVLMFDFATFNIARLVEFKSKDSRQELLKNEVVSGSDRNFNNKFRNKNRNLEQNDASHSNRLWKIPGRRAQLGPQMRMPVPIMKHLVPKELWECHYGERDLLTWLPTLQTDLNWRNYKDKFTTLLHLEEIWETEEMAQFDMEQAYLKEDGAFLSLEVPGLSEGRPSLLVGDNVILTDPDDKFEPAYEGCIHIIRNNEILLQFHETFQDSFENKAYSIKFTLSRTTFRKCHQAVHLFSRIGTKVLFPIKTDLKPPRIKFHSKNVINSCLNDRQLHAVRSILEGSQRPAPYIIYGPPGTGKTVTMIEAILQVFTLRSDSRILVCAASNSAADLLCERLHLSGRVTTTDLVRFIAAYRLNRELPETVRPYSHATLAIEIVYRYRIIVCTCVTSGTLYQIGMRPGHFTHVFIDEAGQSTECESLIPISVTSAQSVTDFQLILAGDPQQLGPVIRSKSARQFGLQISFLERLCKTGPYLRDEAQPGGYNPNYVTKLINNYRSHPSIINVPSQLFYQSELVSKGNLALTHSLLKWDRLRNKDVPILFHGIRSEELQERDSPSWFNPEELIQVVNYLQSLYGIDISPDDVGIITPYRKQVEKIKQMLKAVHVDCPKVGSVEEFQGQERKVIIVSTVRSTDDLLIIDQYNNLGFLFNPKRFNVAVTRAHALLIVIGNPFILVKDYYWRKLLSYCLQKDVYVGVDKEELKRLVDAMVNGSCESEEMEA